MTHPARGRIYLPRFADARAAAAHAGFDRVLTYGGAVPLPKWMSTREEIGPGSVVYYLDGNRLKESPVCPDCRMPFEGPYPNEETYAAALLRPCCRAWTGRQTQPFILGIWPLLRPGEPNPGPDPEIARRAAAEAARARVPTFHPEDCGGAFDGFNVSSDADPGL